MAKTALLLIDLQNDYYGSYEGAKWALEGTELASRNAAKLLVKFRQLKLPVVHVRHEALTDEAPFFLPKSDGAKIHSSVSPVDGEPVVLKNHINSFRETNLQQILVKLGVSKLVIVGAMSHMCIDAVTRAAVDLGYESRVVHDACATLDLTFNGEVVPAKHVHNAFMAALNFGYCNVESTDDILTSLNA